MVPLYPDSTSENTQTSMNITNNHIFWDVTLYKLIDISVDISAKFFSLHLCTDEC